MTHITISQGRVVSVSSAGEGRPQYPRIKQSFEEKYNISPHRPLNFTVETCCPPGLGGGD